jgi:FixJ family two-component response regulator
MSLPDSQGLDSLAKVCARAPGIPVVVLAGVDDEDMALEAVRQGAQDYLLKGAINGRALWRVITYAIERKASEQLLEDISNATIGMYITRDGSLYLPTRSSENYGVHAMSFSSGPGNRLC